MELSFEQLRELICGGSVGVMDKVNCPPCVSGVLRIVVLHRSWVVVGRVSVVSGEVVVSKAAVVRQWGTTKGLGEIALGGPTSKTILDECGVVRVHPLAVVAQFDCQEVNWHGR